MILDYSPKVINAGRLHFSSQILHSAGFYSLISATKLFWRELLKSGQALISPHISIWNAFISSHGYAAVPLWSHLPFLITVNLPSAEKELSYMGFLYEATRLLNR